MAAPSFPFEPKSNAHISPGDFWAVPLSDGRYCAGRVLAVPAFGAKDRVGVVVGLIDWVGATAPTAETIAQHSVLASGKSRFETITETGGVLLGNRSLADDGIEPPTETFHVGENTSVWGSRTILNRAERHFVIGE